MNINRNRHSYLNRISILPEGYETHTIDTSNGDRPHYTKRFNSIRTNERRNCLSGKTVLQIVVEKRDRLNREERDLARIGIDSLKERATRTAELEIQRDDQHEYTNACVNRDIKRRNCDDLFAKFDEFFEKLAQLQNDLSAQSLSQHEDQNQETIRPRAKKGFLET